MKKRVFAILICVILSLTPVVSFAVNTIWGEIPDDYDYTIQQRGAGDSGGDFDGILEDSTTVPDAVCSSKSQDTFATIKIYIPKGAKLYDLTLNDGTEGGDYVCVSNSYYEPIVIVADNDSYYHGPLSDLPVMSNAINLGNFYTYTLGHNFVGWSFVRDGAVNIDGICPVAAFGSPADVELYAVFDPLITENKPVDNPLNEVDYQGSDISDFAAAIGDSAMVLTPFFQIGRTLFPYLFLLVAAVVLVSFIRAVI